MSADRLREAARVLRERAEAATGATHHWRATQSKSSGRGYVYCGNVQIAETDETLGGGPSNATFIATMHPGVALAIADWLDKSAETWERLEDDLRDLEGAPTIEQVYGYDFTEALAVADAILGGTE